MKKKCANHHQFLFETTRIGTRFSNGFPILVKGISLIQRESRMFQKKGILREEILKGRSCGCPGNRKTFGGGGG